MPGDIDKINEIFRINDEIKDDAGDGVFGDSSADAAELEDEVIRTDPVPHTAQAEKNAERERSAKMKAVKQAPPAKTAPAARKAAAKESERDYHPVRQNHEYKTGCLGGIMYFVFIICISVVFACLAWMAASDVLALNKADFTAKVTLPAEIFSSETVDTYDEDGNKTGTKRVTSADITYVANALKEAGLIEYKWLFETYCKISHAERKVSPGEYELDSSYDYRALVQNMRAGSSSALTVDVTIPEGFTMQQIFKRLEENGVCSYDELMDAAANYNFNYSFLEGIETGDASRLEGFLFPDTYQFYVGMQASSAIDKFLKTFYNKMDAELLSQAQTMGLSIKQVVTIASMIEKEAANDNERARIASVIYNRLNSGMALGIDATILYVHQDNEGAPTAEMLVEDSPYNTRLYAGLTPTPICSPGIESIKAALYPETTDYYYYALDTATGEHQFFTNETEHQNFVATQDYG